MHWVPQFMFIIVTSSLAWQAYLFYRTICSRLLIFLKPKVSWVKIGTLCFNWRLVFIVGRGRKRFRLSEIFYFWVDFASGSFKHAYFFIVTVKYWAENIEVLEYCHAVCCQLIGKNNYLRFLCLIMSNETVLSEQTMPNASLVSNVNSLFMDNNLGRKPRSLASWP